MPKEPRSTAKPPQAIVVIDETGEEASPQLVRKRDATATLASLCLHLFILLLLALWAFPSITRSGKVLIELGFDSGKSVEIETLDLVDNVMPMVASELATDTPDVFTPTPIELDLPEAEAETGSQLATVKADSAEFVAESLSSSASVEGAVDRITGQLESKLAKDDLLVVWLLDASNSLVDDRKRVAARLTPFYEKLIQEKSSQKHKLLSAVVSFGSKMRQRVAPTEFGEKIIAAVGDIPVDRTGNEKVFDAVAKCAIQYRSDWDKQCVIVIWTDESGDDVAALPQTIAACRDNQVTVSVVGPSSVLGASTGLHSYTDPKSREVYQLPVLRGPDSPRPERLELGYWHPTTWRGGFRRGLPSWLGGQDLQGILSGFSPYALTRLASQTGGTYTIFDRPEDRGPFDSLTMRQYAPSYESQELYEQSIQSSPLRRGIMGAVGELRGRKVDSPPMMLFTKKTGDRIFDFMRYYYTPREFQAKLRSSRGRLKGQALRSSKLIDKALRHLSTDATLMTGLDEAYQNETSHRWRAWYDLTRGRLLANSARLEEYRLILDELIKPGALQNTTNHVVLVADQKIRAGEKHRKQAEEAERLLRRCVYDNKGTPWEILAQRELDYAIGLAAREMSLTQTPAGPSAPRPNLPRF